MARKEDEELVKALMDGDTKSVSEALAHGADPNTRMGNTVTPLLWAVMFGPEECIEPLIKAGADVNSQDTVLGNTALHYASIVSEDARIVETLIAAGANVNATNKSGYTALDHAAGACNESGAAALARAGGKCRADRSEWVNRVVANLGLGNRRGR